MRISKRTYAIVAVVLALLLLVSAFNVFSNSANGTVDASIASTNVGVATGYDDLLQYEWPQIHGNSAFTRFSLGPAPEAPDILQKRTIEGVQSFVAAFNGKVYATTGQNASIDPFAGKYSKSELACLDAYTGKLLWKLPIEAYAPRESTAIAYGNLYFIPGYIEENTMDSYTTLNEVWAIGNARAHKNQVTPIEN